MTESLSHLFADIRAFGWDPTKRESNLQDHSIDFNDVWQIFQGPCFTRRSDRYGEVRYQVFGYLENREVAVACAIRDSLCWVISARRARKDERRKYYNRASILASKGQD